MSDDYPSDDWVVVEILNEWGGTYAYKWASEMKKKWPGCAILREKQWPVPSGSLLVYMEIRHEEHEH